VPKERWRRRATECTRSSSLGLSITVGVSGRKVLKALAGRGIIHRCGRWE
jgi:hypothetical protein